MGALWAAGSAPDLGAEKPYVPAALWSYTEIIIRVHAPNCPPLPGCSISNALQFPSQQKASGVAWGRKLEIWVLSRTVARRCQAEIEIPLSKWK